MIPRLRPAHVVLALSLLLLMATPLVVWLGSGAPASVGERPARTIDTTQQRAELTAPRIGTPVAQELRAELPAPSALVIPTLGVEAPIDAVGVLADGGVEIPDDVSRVGWYRFGTTPGDNQGSAVLVGHRDGWNEGRGALYNVAALELGDEIVVRNEAGDQLTYTVVAREIFDKKVVPLGELFSERGDHRLTLISCIGYFSRDNGGYQQNVVVTAVPSGAQGLV